MKKCGACSGLYIVIDPIAYFLFEVEMFKTMLCISHAAPHQLYFLQTKYLALCIWRPLSLKYVLVHHFRPVAPPLKVGALEWVVDKKNYHRVPRIRENYHRVPRIRGIGSLQVHTGYLTFSSKKPARSIAYKLTNIVNLQNYHLLL